MSNWGKPLRSFVNENKWVAFRERRPLWQAAWLKSSRGVQMKRTCHGGEYRLLSCLEIAAVHERYSVSDADRRGLGSRGVEGWVFIRRYRTRGGADLTVHHSGCPVSVCNHSRVIIPMSKKLESIHLSVFDSPLSRLSSSSSTLVPVSEKWTVALNRLGISSPSDTKIPFNSSSGD